MERAPKWHLPVAVVVLLVAADPQAVLVARDNSGLIGFCVSRFDDGTICSGTNFPLPTK